MPDGNTVRGRAQLESEFTAYFAETKNAKLELIDTNVEVLSPSVAVETGTARVMVPEDEPGETNYKAIHVKTTEGWRIDSVRDQEAAVPPPSHYEQLKPLEWMVGKWADKSEKAEIETSCRWATNQNFIVRTFRVFVDGQVDFEGTDVIGWDPHHKPSARGCSTPTADLVPDGGRAVKMDAGPCNRCTCCPTVAGPRPPTSTRSSTRTPSAFARLDGRWTGNCCRASHRWKLCESPRRKRSESRNQEMNARRGA